MQSVNNCGFKRLRVNWRRLREPVQQQPSPDTSRPSQTPGCYIYSLFGSLHLIARCPTVQSAGLKTSKTAACTDRQGPPSSHHTPKLGVAVGGAAGASRDCVPIPFVCSPLCGPPPVWADSDEQLTNWSTGSIVGKSPSGTPQLSWLRDKCPSHRDGAGNRLWEGVHLWHPISVTLSVVHFAAQFSRLWDKASTPSTKTILTGSFCFCCFKEVSRRVSRRKDDKLPVKYKRRATFNDGQICSDRARCDSSISPPHTLFRSLCHSRTLS